MSMSRIKAQQGFTLVELMVTLAISAVIMTGVINLYTNSIVQSKQTGDLVGVQESGRFALELLSRDFRMAGYTGCMAYDSMLEDPDQFMGLYSRGGVAFNLQAMLGIQGWEAANTAAGDEVDLDSQARVGTDGGSWETSGGNTLTETYEEAVEGSDIVRLWTAGDVLLDVQDMDHTGNTIAMTLASGHGLQSGDIVMLANCGRRVIAQICSTTSTTATISDGSSGTCNNSFDDYAGIDLTVDEVEGSQEGYEVYSFRDVTYFIGKRDDGDDTPPSLYRAVNNVAREMVEGVESMQVLYGVDLDHQAGELRNADIYVPANGVGTRWGDVVSVRISLLIRSFEKVLGDTSYTVDFNGATITRDDGYIRQVYSTTISLRNRNVGDIDGTTL